MSEMTKDDQIKLIEKIIQDVKFAMMTTIDGYSGVEIVYPYEVRETAATRAALSRHSLQVAAGDRHAQHGGFEGAPYPARLPLWPCARGPS